MRERAEIIRLHREGRMPMLEQLLRRSEARELNTAKIKEAGCWEMRA